MSNLEFSGFETRMGDKKDEQQDYSKDGDSSTEVGKELMAFSIMVDKEIGNCSFEGDSVIGERYTDLTNQANNGAQEDNSKSRGIDEVFTKDRESTWQNTEHVNESVDIDGVDKWAKVLDNEKELDLNFGKQANKSVEAGPISQESDKIGGELVGTCDGPSIKEVLHNSNDNLLPSWSNGGSISPKLQRERKNRKKVVKSLEEIENLLLSQVSKKIGVKGRRSRKLRRNKKKDKVEENIANDSLTDSDFENRQRILRQDAIETWAVGKLVGFSINCYEEEVIDRLMHLEEKHKKRR